MLNETDYLFTFAIIGDTHIKPESGDNSAPWKVNDLATGRARWIAREVARYEPRFIVHLGDLVHPIPELPTFSSAVDLTKSVFNRQRNRIHIIPGNHDIGDKPNHSMPAKAVREDWISRFEQEFGPSYSSFDLDGLRFLFLNNPILNSGFDVEIKQRSWLEKQLTSAGDKRIFVFMHYPLFLLDSEEPSSYDNIDEPARADILRLLKQHKVEAVFAGHVHNTFYNRLESTEFYMMPATSFVRQDYAELFRTPPASADENGRDDREKLGFALVDVYSTGHITHFMRSYGRTLESSSIEDQLAARSAVKCLSHPKKGRGSPLAVYLRHPWAEHVTLPHNGPNDEFVRKEIRNDYPLAALWRMGISQVRIPQSDILCERLCRRIADLHAIGHRFNVFGVGVPKTKTLWRLEANAGLVDHYELIMPRNRIAADHELIKAFRVRFGRPLFLSPIATSADDKKEGSRNDIFVSHGFRPDQLSEIEALCLKDRQGVVDGFVIRVARGANLAEVIPNLDKWANENHVQVDLHLRLASANPAENVTDPTEILNRVVELYAFAVAYPKIKMTIETLMDVDRGYFVRSGLIDRRCNLNPAGLALETLAAFVNLNSKQWKIDARDVTGGRILDLKTSDEFASIILPSLGSEVTLRQDEVNKYALLRTSPTMLRLDEPWQLQPHLGTASKFSIGNIPLTIKYPVLIMTNQGRS